MKSRRMAREVALQILYSFDRKGTEFDPAQLKSHFEHFKVPESLQAFAQDLVMGTLKSIGQIDPILEKHATNWKVSRMPSVDRSLLRMAIYEMLNYPDIDAEVTINEAIELAKEFGTEESPPFINGILDSVKKNR